MTRPEAPDSGPWAPVAASHVNLSVAALPPASAPPALPSSSSARYTARRLIGQGRMGRVFAVHDTVLGRDVALKEVQPRADLHALEQRLLAEARLTAAIAHPAVLPILDVGLGDDGRLHYTMPLVRGRSLGEAIAGPDDALRARPGRLPTAALRRLLTACEAVAAAHRRGILHRDLKPENILVGSAGETWVADWGLAIQASDAASAGSPPEPVGTPGYVAPEVVGGAPPTPASDVWALGVILAEVATGQRQLGLLPPGALPPIEPPALAAIVHKALAPDPAARYPSAAELAEDLADLLDGRRVGAYTYSRRELLARFITAWRVPLLVALAGLILAGVVLALSFSRLDAENARARAAEADTRVALGAARAELARALANEAMVHAERDTTHEAERLARASLETANSPLARGILAMMTGGRSLSPLSSRPLPPCRAHVLSPDGQRFACVDNDHLSLWAIDGRAPIWETPTASRAAAFTDEALVSLGQDRSLAFHALDDGSIIASYPNIFVPIESTSGATSS